MDFLKWVAAVVLVIMALTWARISIDHGVMVAVSGQFYWVAGTLASIVGGKGVKDAWNSRPGGRP